MKGLPEECLRSLFERKDAGERRKYRSIALLRIDAQSNALNSIQRRSAKLQPFHTYGNPDKPNFCWSIKSACFSTNHKLVV
ncbi:hypothetical protein RvY_09295 [Ramazzottius varieornatus]|uniref:Uncharacterized protein n=1 Tax=Ramazzottius varieornatus TaxID=947166 RepID=A0A1D1VB20_RAMVA|nr:hypothetical protein RvY_09295 [Ramazzottius varieornatus]